MQDRMNPGIKKQWIAALRSGDYQQGKQFLHPGPDFCCLGVICNLVKDKVGFSWHEDSKHDKSIFSPVYSLGPDMNARSLPMEVIEFIGLNSRDGILPFWDKQGVRMTLATLNDFGFTFAQIADVIDYFF